MGLPDRIGWMLLGCAVGFFAGYVVRFLQDMKEELDEVDGIVKKKLGEREADKDAKPRKSDPGFVRNDLFKDVSLLVVVIITVVAAFMSATASSRVKATQDEQRHDTDCTQQYLTATVKALNERAEFTIAQANANLDLQTSQAEFFGLLLRRPPETVRVREAAAQQYLDDLHQYITIVQKTKVKAELFPYPSDKALANCYNHK
jgi:hypothetical protein